MAKYKVMVVGMGKRGKHHAAAFQANENFEVVGICDISQDMQIGRASCRERV